MGPTVIGKGDTPDTVLVQTPTCMYCWTSSQLAIPETGWKKWQQGAYLLQEALPELSAATREMLISGTHPDCWNAMKTKLNADED
jgi:hypothetical protein